MGVRCIVGQAMPVYSLSSLPFTQRSRPSDDHRRRNSWETSSVRDQKSRSRNIVIITSSQQMSDDDVSSKHDGGENQIDESLVMASALLKIRSDPINGEEKKKDISTAMDPGLGKQPRSCVAGVEAQAQQPKESGSTTENSKASITQVAREYGRNKAMSSVASQQQQQKPQPQHHHPTVAVHPQPKQTALKTEKSKANPTNPVAMFRLDPSLTSADSQQAHPQHQHQQPLTAHQIAVLQAAAVAGAASLAAAASQQQIQPASVPLMSILSDRFCGISGSNHPAAVSISPSLTQSSCLASNAGPKPSGTGTKTEASIADGNLSQQADLQQQQQPTASAKETDAVIRREQVEAALRSKPQRGRKRYNLSEMERLELTRTRNREHAKSTRVRKKARYQELLDREKKLEDYERNEELSCKRKECLLNFISFRERMLQAGSGLDTSRSSRSEDTEKMANGGSSVKAFEELLLNPSEFRFNCVAPACPDLPWMERMKHFDETMITRISSSCGDRTIPLLRYIVPGGSNSVALSSAGTGFVQVELVIGGHDELIRLVSAVLYAEYARQSEKLVCVTWISVKDSLDEDSLERLDAQISYPSVVSLDRSNMLDTEDEKCPSTDEEQNPQRISAAVDTAHPSTASTASSSSVGDSTTTSMAGSVVANSGNVLNTPHKGQQRQQRDEEVGGGPGMNI